MTIKNLINYIADRIRGCKKQNITMHYGGGCLFLKCHNCNKDVGHADVDFPGTFEQQKEPREILEKIKQNHKCCESKIISNR